MQIGSSGPWCKRMHAMVDLGGQEVKAQGHRKPKLDLEAWRRHHS